MCDWMTHPLNQLWKCINFYNMYHTICTLIISYRCDHTKRVICVRVIYLPIFFMVASLALYRLWLPPQIAKFMGPTWGPPGSCRPQMGPMLASWTLLSGSVSVSRYQSHIIECCFTGSLAGYDCPNIGKVGTQIWQRITRPHRRIYFSGSIWFY